MSFLKTLLENPDLLKPKNVDSDQKNGGGSDNKKDPGSSFAGQSAFLGPTLWDKTLPIDISDLTLEYMDLDEFLGENALMNPANMSPGGRDILLDECISPNEVLDFSKKKEAERTLIASPVSVNSEATIGAVDTADTEATAAAENEEDDDEPSIEVPFEMNPDDIALVTLPGQNFDPKKRKFDEEELRPQPIIKKAKKVFVPDVAKDEKYWKRRNKNNVAAKRSREARRIKENQIALRAAFLEKENQVMMDEVAKVKQENAALKLKLQKYEPDIVL